MSREQIEVAIIFADICRSTQLFELYGDTRARELISRTLSTLSDVTARHDGQVVKTIGDELLCTFPSAEHAVHAACEMQALVSQAATDPAPNVRIRVGLQSGTVLAENGDVFGDAVNVAARMAGIAKADQIITTRETVDRVPDDAGVLARSLGQVNVRGKHEPMEICEVIWQKDTSGLTTAPATRLPFERLRSAQLRLTYRDNEVEMGPERRSLALGRGETSDLVVDETMVSRNHATIERRRDKFVLMDHSTNGTFVRIDGEPDVFVHREEIHLHGQGVISLGQQITTSRSSQIRYAVRRYLAASDRPSG